MYMTFEVVIKCFLKYIRLVIVVVEHCKRKYKGVMLVAVLVDANKKIYSLALRSRDKKNGDLWTWSMRRL